MVAFRGRGAGAVGRRRLKSGAGAGAENPNRTGGLKKLKVTRVPRSSEGGITTWNGGDSPAINQPRGGRGGSGRKKRDVARFQGAGGELGREFADGEADFGGTSFSPQPCFFTRI